LSQQMAYILDISWSRAGQVGDYDVVFRRGREEQAEGPQKVKAIIREEQEQGQAWSEYANAPLKRQEMLTLISQLRSLLKERLPNFMIPAAIVVLEALPLTANGKVDRRALPAPDGSRHELEESLVAPRTSLEELVARSWSQILGIEQVGIHDDFFALGGHSLLAMQVISHLRAVLQVEVPLYRFLEAPTVAQLAEILEQPKAERAKSRMPALRSISREAYRVPSLQKRDSSQNELGMAK